MSFVGLITFDPFRVVAILNYFTFPEFHSGLLIFDHSWSFLAKYNVLITSHFITKISEFSENIQYLQVPLSSFT